LGELACGWNAPIARPAKEVLEMTYDWLYSSSVSKKSLRLPGGDLEYAVMFAVCELNQASARDVHLRVREADGLAYTTIAKVLDRLHLKRLVRRTRRGRAFVYRPRVTREVIELTRARATLGKLLAADVRPAMATLVEAMESLDPELLDELDRAVAARRGTRDGS
jgi:BlaI family transcriptional regulator, penicillinase repressor